MLCAKLKSVRGIQDVLVAQLRDTASSVFNLVNNVAGAGLLTLSGGMPGAGGKAGVGAGPAGIMGVGLCLLSAFMFSKIGKCCEALGVSDFRGLWCATIGPNSAWVIDLCIAQMCLSSCIIYSGIIGDIFTSLGRAAGVAASLKHRWSNLLAITGSSLRPFSRPHIVPGASPQVTPRLRIYRGRGGVRRGRAALYTTPLSPSEGESSNDAQSQILFSAHDGAYCVVPFGPLRGRHAHGPRNVWRRMPGAHVHVICSLAYPHEAH